VLVAAAVIVADRGAFKVDSGSGGELSGRGSLASGGLDIAGDRPLEGFGSGSFATEFDKRNDVEGDEAVVSHTEPITVVAEQGTLGVLVYIAVLLAALGVLIGAGLGAVAPGLGGKAPPEIAPTAGRIAIAAAFGGLLIHTIGYAGFFTDPLTWALLAVGSALATIRS
jgi:putative inorganic carbon (hco3(-)) transporter